MLAKSARAGAGRSARNLTGKIPVHMATATVPPRALPMLATTPSIARIAGKVLRVETAITVICEQMTRVPPPNTTKI